MLILCHPFDTYRIDHSIYNHLMPLHMHCAAFHLFALAACDGIFSMNSLFHSDMHMDHHQPKQYNQCYRSPMLDAAVAAVVVMDGKIYHLPPIYIDLSWHSLDSNHVHRQLIKLMHAVDAVAVDAVAHLTVEHRAMVLEVCLLMDWMKQTNTVMVMVLHNSSTKMIPNCCSQQSTIDDNRWW